MTEPHLGGHLNMTHVDEASLVFIKENFGCETMVDIGCSVGGQVKKALQVGYKEAIGIDGDRDMLKYLDGLILHDYTKGAYKFDKRFDLAWSCEFLEHVEEKYVDNFMQTFECCDHAFITHALPNTKGHHHVNCQLPEYWVKVFYKYGFDLDLEATEAIRKISSMDREFARDNGLFFKKSH